MEDFDFFNDTAQIAQMAAWDLRALKWTKVIGSVASDGVYLKSEIDVAGERIYLKLSNYDSYRGVFGHESVNELIACRLGKLLGFNLPDGTLKKALVNVDGAEFEAYVFAAKSFKTAENRCSFEDFYRNRRLSAKESPLDLCKRFQWETEIYQMFIFDYLIINRDRHGANLEVLKNSSLKLSPLFDNGLSFVCAHTEPEDVSSFDALEDKAANNFIGERSLEKNLLLIDKKLRFNELLPEHEQVLFERLSGVLAPVYYEKIWEILHRRWEHVKDFRAIR